MNKKISEIKKLKKAFAAAAKKQKGAFDRDAWKDATDEEKLAERTKRAIRYPGRPTYEFNAGHGITFMLTPGEWIRTGSFGGGRWEHRTTNRSAA